MSATAAKAENEINKICRKLGISEQGKRWLDIALDPCKDMIVEKAGYPDAIAVPSAIQTIHDQLTITVPGSVGAGSNWDANIFLDQVYSQTNLFTNTSTNPTNAYYVGQGVTAYPRGGLVVRSGPAGAALDYLTTTGGLSLKPDILTEGEFRVVAIGLEVHNTTSELNKQGAVITWRDADGPEDLITVNVYHDNGITACLPAAFDCLKLTRPPQTPGEAIDLPNSLEWEAQNGAYIVPILANPVMKVGENQLLAVACIEPATTMFPAVTEIGAAKRMNVVSNNTQTGFNMCGAYFTGLSYSSTLQVNLTYYVQIFPFPTSVLRRLVTPSSGEDALAIKLYDRISSHLPTGVYVSENFLGGFIAGISKIAAQVVKYAPTVMSVGSAILDFASDAGMGRQKESRSEETRGMRGTVTEFRSNNNNSAPPYGNVQIVSDRQIVPYVPRSVPEPTRSNDVVVKYHKTESGGVTAQSSVVRSNNSRRKRSAKSNDMHNQAIYNAYKGQTGSRWVENAKTNAKSRR